MNRSEKRALRKQLRVAAKGLAAEGVEVLFEGEQAVTLLTDEIGEQAQHMAVVVSVNPHVTAAIAELLDQMFTPEGEE